MGELVPAWFRITNQFKHLSPELATEVSLSYLFVTMRYSIRTLLHYPDGVADVPERGGARHEMRPRIGPAVHGEI